MGVPYSHTIYKMIDEVIEFQLDHMGSGELEEFYKEQMFAYYEDKKNAREFNDAWVQMKEMME